MASSRFPVYRQLDARDCGPTCVRMIAKHYGKSYSLQYLREHSFYARGVSLLGIRDAAEHIGLHTQSARIPLEKLYELPLPCILHWKKDHFVVLYKIKKDKFYIADPAQGILLTYTTEEFVRSWVSIGTDEGLVLILTPTPAFYEKEGEKRDSKMGFGFLLQYLRPFKKLLVQLFLGLILGSILQLIFPFLTQSIVDFGINNQNIGFVYTILIAQLVLFLSQAAVEFLRGWILLHIGTRVNVAILSDFLMKLMKLPIAFFDTKTVGDLMQRIIDHRRIENFLASTTL